MVVLGIQSIPGTFTKKVVIIRPAICFVLRHKSKIGILNQPMQKKKATPRMERPLTIACHMKIFLSLSLTWQARHN